MTDFVICSDVFHLFQWYPLNQFYIDELSYCVIKMSTVIANSSFNKHLKGWPYANQFVDNLLLGDLKRISIKGNMHKPDLKIRCWCVYIP